ncbi:transketolase [uncultured Fenollaria sp.]|uniref:transketolase n=1 Tax=uncultured Fenollaria sp. TaxID=1686315 RepID=UPI0025E51058|nr:transketolase [uncultured Fenollaria sp.]
MDVKQKVINTIRVLSAEAIEKANSGHPGLPLGAAPAAFTLFNEHLKHNPKNPDWINRDRFILSAGHGSMLLYSLLNLYGYGLKIEDLENFRQFDSLTPGHPEYMHTKGVEASTGPLGQGIAMGVGMAIAERHLAALFNKDDNKLIDHMTYILCGDGCLQEGISNEASSLAGTLKLNKLVVLYDSNNITIEGDTEVAFAENVRARYEALGWNTLYVEDGNEIEAISKAISEAKKSTDKPTLIEIKTKIGYGATGKEGTAGAHGAPLGAESLAALRKNLQYEEEGFNVSQDVLDYMKEKCEELDKYEEDWYKQLEAYKAKYKADYDKLMSFYDKEVSEEVLKAMTDIELKDDASRASSGKVLNKVSHVLENIIGGSADLGPSNKSVMNDEKYFSSECPEGRNIHFGVREHAMAAICNGILLHGGLRSYAATFLVFSDYMKPSIRLASLMNLPAIYILTHDSIGVGEDGPTHQPIEHLAMLRSIPNINVIRPADSREVIYAWQSALMSKETPTCLILSRQGLKLLDNSSEEALKGGYIVHKEAKDAIDAIIIATGSEVALSIEAAKDLEAKGKSIRVVSMPSQEIFLNQDKEYIEKILPSSVKRRVSVEALSTMPWGKFVGLEGTAIGIDRFGSSAPGKVLFEKYGITKEHVEEEVSKLIEK